MSNRCTILVGLEPSTNPDVCTTHTTHSPYGGGSLEQSYNGTAGGLRPLLFEAVATARSSTFRTGQNRYGAPGTMTFEFGRRADVGTAANADGQVEYQFFLTDLTAGTDPVLLYRETLDDTANVFEGRLQTELPPPGPPISIAST